MSGSKRNRKNWIGKRCALASAVLTAIAMTGGTALANPVGGTVVGGSATIDQSSATQTVINQTSNRAIINWQGFSIGSGESTLFQQPSAASVVLNRVTGGDPSEILGRLSANGNVFIVNPNGIVFGAGARVDVNGLVATTHDITNDDFMAGNYRFNIPGRADAMVINHGQITAADAGLVALVAPAVWNDGVIVARLGRVALASATGFTLDLYGDGLVQLAVDPVTLAAITPDGQPVSSLVQNDGTISAEGGTVLITANAARGVVNNVINNTGLISAASARLDGGKIILEAGDNNLANSGTLDASGLNGGTVSLDGNTVMVSGDARVIAAGTAGNGGTIHLLGDQVGLTDRAAIDASGATGGGTVLVGGDYQGSNSAIRNANAVYFGSDATIRADALQSGNGGKVILWSDAVTRAFGSISARGGNDAGDGGFVETSSHGTLNAVGVRVNTGAINGARGQWLLDPTDITIIHGSFTGAIGAGGLFSPGASSTISDGDITSAIANGDVTIRTDGGTGGNGDITINGSFDAGGAVSIQSDAGGGLYLYADRNININNGASVWGNASPFNLSLNSARSGTGSTTFSGGMIDLLGGTLSFSGGALNMAGSSASIFRSTIVSNGPALQGSGFAMLSNVTLGDATRTSLTLSGDFHLTGALSLANGATVNLGTSRLQLDTNGIGMAIGAGAGSATVNLAGGILHAFGTSAGASTIGTGVTVQGYGTLGMNSTGSAADWVNNGKIMANLGGRTLNIASSGFTNNATLGASGGVLNVTSSSLTNTGTIGVSAGTVNLDAASWSSPLGSSFAVTGGTLNLGGSFMDSDLHFASRTAGTVNVTGSLLVNTELNIGSNGTFGLGGLGAVIGDTATLSGAGAIYSMDGHALNMVGRPNLEDVTLGRAGYTLTINGDLDFTNIIDLATGATVDKGSSVWRTEPTFTNVDITGSGTLFSRGGGIYTNYTEANAMTLTIGAGTTLRGNMTLGDTGLAQKIVVNGTLYAGAGEAINSTTANLTLDGAVLTGGGTINVQNALNVINTQIGTNTLLQGGVTLNTAGATTVGDPVYTFALRLNGATWNNKGTVSFISDDYLSLEGASTVNNAVGGTFNFATTNPTDITSMVGSTAVFNNAGTFSQTAMNTHSIVPYVTFNNTGAVTLKSGTLTIEGNGMSPGTFAIDAGATLAFGGSSLQNLGSTGQISGTGSLQFFGSGITFTGTADTVSSAPLLLALDKGPVVIGSITQPLHGTLVDNGDGTFTYVPKPGYVGTDVFKYMVAGNGGGTALAAMKINVAPIPNEVLDPKPVILASNEYGKESTTDGTWVIDQGPDAGAPGSLRQMPLVDSVGKLGDYTPEQQAAFYNSLTAEGVVGSLKASGQNDLAQLLGAAAAGGKTSAADLRNLLSKSGLGQAQQGWLGVYMRMRQIGMQQRLASAIEVLRGNPDAADEIDEGVAGGPIGIDAPTQLRTGDGLIQVSGRVKSGSKALEVRLNGRWVHVDEQGRFRYRTAVRAGSQNMVLEARDPSGAKQNVELQVSSDVDGRQEPVKGRRVALLLAVQEYDNSIPELETPVADAESLAGTLRSQYGFETQVVANPTKRQILESLRRTIDQLGENDSLTVFYAGHGYQMQQTGRGYWLPRDADTANPRNWVSNRDVARLFQRARSRQILLISDSCYSGAFVGGGGPQAPAGAPGEGRAVMAFSSGGNEPVWDGGGEGHSLFASRLVQSLEHGNNASGAQLFNTVRGEVVKASPQVPEYGAMVSAGYDPGADYLLK